MNNWSRSALAALLVLAFNAQAQESFEGVGTIDKVDVGHEQISINEKNYKLAHELKINNVAAIFSLQESCRVQFSGKSNGSDLPEITNFYLFNPDCLKH